MLILAGEAIFILPFVLARVFRPTLLEVFQINNFQLGTYFSAYGVVAMVSYLLGGPLADRFKASNLISFALATTSLGGFYLATIPEPTQMKLLYCFWGMTTILLFWAALLKATREWGGNTKQGLAFGLLDGGRGMVSAIIGSISVVILAWFLPMDGIEISPEQRKEAFQNVILFVSGFVFLTAILVRFVLPSETPVQSSSSGFSIEKFKEIAGRPLIWLQALIIVCGYSGYKVTDDFSLLASDVLGYNEIESAKVGTLSLWLRPIVAISAGLLADKVSTSKMILVSFLFLFVGGILIGTGLASPSLTWLVFVAIISTCIAVFSLRGLYFALMEEAKIPWHVTGTAVGTASILGYTPDIYMGPLMGYLLDSSPGPVGHQHVFLLLVGFSIVGFITTLVFRYQAKKQG
ncbi:MAG: MFS family permease [Bacteroidia bacterium]